jgi:hypothetical protein
MVDAIVGALGHLGKRVLAGLLHTLDSCFALSRGRDSDEKTNGVKAMRFSCVARSDAGYHHEEG